MGFLKKGTRFSKEGQIVGYKKGGRQKKKGDFGGGPSKTSERVTAEIKEAADRETKKTYEAKPRGIAAWVTRGLRAATEGI
ncbi:hypothetical protein SLEP1_g8610 [Rubroshorea leprosula]|uniref:Uncharacterized protein n=1 Tax=Rubroshorea leprosula TaxID=152421 RepID=A0AAV5I2A8_9ROSI|nr:hypothetical protein SLEP1_g8610 [Rubroshorea leprosula]